MADEALLEARWKTEARQIALEVRKLEDRIKQLENVLSTVSKGPRWEYKGSPQEYFDALKKSWALLEESKGAKP